MKSVTCAGLLAICATFARVGAADAQAENKAMRPALRGLLDMSAALTRVRAAGSRPTDAVAMGLARAKAYTFATADYPGAAYSDLWDSNTKTVLGTFAFDPGNSPFTPFTLKGGAYKVLEIPGSAGSLATAINSSGLVVGTYADISGVVRGFSLDSSTLTTIDFPGASFTQPIGLNDAGQIVGSYFVAGNSGERGFLLSGGVFTSIDVPGASGTGPAGINSTGDIVGAYRDSTGDHGFILKAGVFTPINFPLATGTLPYGINDSGEIAGYYTDSAGVSHGFIQSAGTFSTVDVVGARQTFLTRIKNRGQVVGLFIDARGEVHGLTGQ